MATAVSTKPSQAVPKMKRPAPLAVQTSVNGVNASTSSPSPSLSARRTPSSSKHAPASAGGGSNSNSASTTVNGTGPRSSNRQRKDTNKLSNGFVKPSRTASAAARGSTADAADQDGSRLAKLPPQPYVHSTAHILKKFKGSSPSLIIHLHPTHFRFDQQDGSFGYNSPMRPVLEHIRNQTIPHDILEELFASKVHFYDGHLIIQVHDHRSIPASQESTSTASSGSQRAAPFSVHNYNEHLTPSPYVPYPSPPKKSQAPKEGSQPPTTNGQSRSTPSTDQSKADETKIDKPAAGTQTSAPEASSTKSKSTSKAKIYTTVLHPTALSLQAEMTILAATPDYRVSGRRQPAHTPNAFALQGSATSHPPTPMSAVPPQTARSNNGPPQKRQKMLLDEGNLHDFEAEVLRCTSDPLYLEPSSDQMDAINVVKALRHPLHQGKPPRPTTRKRTVAELAADEAVAAEEERFMLLMDERLASAVSGAVGGGKGAAVDGQTGSLAFEPRFQRFKTLENIKEEQRKQKEEKALQQMQAEQAKRQQQEQLEKEKRKEAEEKQRQEVQRREQYRAQLAARAAQQAQQAQQQAAQLQAAQAAQAQGQPNGMGQAPQPPHLQHVSQAQHSSPVAQSSPPRISSPMVGNAMGSHAPGGIAMNVTSSGHGPGSPARSASAAQHRAPSMAHQMSIQRSQQGPSRHGTPQAGHPATSTPRMSQASPVPGAAVRTPMMHPGMAAGTPHMQNNHLSPQQRQMLQMQQQQQQQQQQQNAQQHGIHQSPQPNMAQMSPQQIAAFQAARMGQRPPHQQQPSQQQLDQRQQFSNYDAQLAQQMQNMANNAGAHQTSPGGMQQAPNGIPANMQQQQQYRAMQAQQRQRELKQIHDTLTPDQQSMFRQVLSSSQGQGIPARELHTFRNMALQNARANMTPQQQQQQIMRIRALQQMGQGQGQGRGGMIPNLPGMGAMPGQGRGMG